MDEMVANSPWQIAIFSDMFGENGGCKIFFRQNGS